MTPLTRIGGYDVHLLIQGFPGKSNENGGLGWSSVVLLRGHDRNILVDTGSFSVRRVLTDRLKSLGIARGDVTDLLLTHAHYDHMMNWTLFPNARIALFEDELDWALGDDIEGSLCAELYVRELARSEQLSRISVGDTGLPGIASIEAPGHTPHHLVFVIDDGERRVILAADAVKNRAEFVSESAVSTLDPVASNESIRAVKKLWLERDDSMLICGHDLPIVNDKGEARYMGERRAGVTAWFDLDLSKPTKFALKD
jgi:N-acyl homoserine lactone hydrolase